ncbi:RsmB/NOP family class I SAM-dependent RNA methyltransferase [Chitinophaga qingshengii]|uniref:RsmB/NOP family class I SAM-dependent RNA methyltransferase n=1 Tax=Chitinophaga qingshengii TaxID=1569794 RepID=A0ABR7TM05_9BACT|nr:RsmB/NOP family class I SAM-dependent RNA methyltransferase [Chitinophaga qingshengii]MBC9930655.1 RsmB/NOP family class I SAM-dependent RNA methyltransferase [Chitinophaga qingshengii]
MTRWENYVASATKIIGAYQGSLPLHHFLKTFFKEHPYMGSRDRRWISQLVYHYYRLGDWGHELPVTERLLAGTFLCEHTSTDLLKALKPEWDEQAGLSLSDKAALLELPVTATRIFPLLDELSPAIDAEAFGLSFLQQPKLFIRVRNNRMDKVLRLLQQAAVSYEVFDNNATVALPNGTKVETLLPEKSWYEIQDASSQQTGALFHPAPQQRWWDCCAASGGKSILLKDQQPGVQLLVSDVRRSILENLQQRFAAAGIKNYEARVADLTADRFPETMGQQRFDGIILDAPCSGSGTWGRTPESVSFFKREEISKYQQLQKRIAHNVIPFLKKGGALIYITCSVFRQENEEVVQYIEENSDLRQQEGGVIAGYGKGADTMFAVRFS